MVSLRVLLVLLALVCFLVGAFVTSARVNFTALGLFFATAATLVAGR